MGFLDGKNQDLEQVKQICILILAGDEQKLLKHKWSKEKEKTIEYYLHNQFLEIHKKISRAENEASQLKNIFKQKCIKEIINKEQFMISHQEIVSKTEYDTLQCQIQEYRQLIYTLNAQQFTQKDEKAQKSVNSYVEVNVKLNQLLTALDHMGKVGFFVPLHKFRDIKKHFNEHELGIFSKFSELFNQGGQGAKIWDESEERPINERIKKLTATLQCKDPTEFEKIVADESFEMKDILTRINCQIQEFQLLKKYLKELNKKTNEEAFAKQLLSHQLSNEVELELTKIWEKISDLKKIKKKCCDLKISSPVTTDDVIQALTYIQSLNDLFKSIKRYLPGKFETLELDNCFFSIWYKFIVILQSLESQENIFDKPISNRNNENKNEICFNECETLRKEISRYQQKQGESTTNIYTIKPQKQSKQFTDIQRQLKDKQDELMCAKQKIQELQKNYNSLQNTASQKNSQGSSKGKGKSAKQTESQITRLNQQIQEIEKQKQLQAISHTQMIQAANKEIKKLKIQKQAIHKDMESQRYKYMEQLQKQNQEIKQLKIQKQAIYKDMESQRYKFMEQLQAGQKKFQEIFKKNQSLESQLRNSQQEKDELSHQSNKLKQSVGKLEVQLEQMRHKSGNPYDKMLCGATILSYCPSLYSLEPSEKSKSISAYKQQLCTKIEDLCGKKILQTQVLYQYPITTKHKANFHEFFDNIPNTLLIIELQQNGFIIGGFCEDKFTPQITKQQGNGMIFSLHTNKFYERKKTNTSSVNIMYDKHFLIYGNSELRISNSEDKVHSNIGIRNKYFETFDDKHEDFWASSENPRKIKAYQIHRIVFDQL